MADPVANRTPPRVAPRVSAAPAGPERCPEHGLALAPDGKCTLCRRSKVILYDQESPSRVATLLLGLCFVLSLVFGIQWARDPASFPLAEYLDSAVPTAEPITPDLPEAPQQHQPVSEGELAAKRLAAEQAAEEEPTEGDAPDEAKPHDSPASAEGEPPDDTAAKAATAEEEAVRDAERSAMVQNQIADHERQAALRSLHVVMYATRWCPFCAKAREHMRRLGIGYTERDIDQDAVASARHRELNPAGSLPTFDIEGETLIGFDPSTFDAALDRALARSARKN